MDRKGLFYLLGLVLMVVLASPVLGVAADTELENALQGNLQESRDLLARVRKKLRAREGISADLFLLKSVAEEIRTSDLLLQERFALREEKLQELGANVEARHRAMTEGYRKALQDYLNLVASLPAGDEVSSALLENLQILLDKIIPKKRRPILGSLPYRNLQYPLKDPNADPSITPAYLGGNRAVVPEDLKDPSSKAISALAQSLNWNPVSIYEWVKNNVETEWYFGCMKGAEETLRQKSGNDCDQAALLVALLRASGFPSRYIRGVIEFFPDITQAKNLTGIDDEKDLASFFQKAGIPFRPIVAGGKIANLQIEHIWVESQIPYSNYRGAVLDEEGKSWIALDTSIKAAGYDSILPADLPPEPFFSEIRDQYLGALRTETPLEFIQSKLEAYLSQVQPGKHYSDLLRRRTLLPEVLNILPSGLQFRPIKITQEYSEIPEALVHRVRMIASGCGLRVAGCGEDRALFNITLPAAQLSNQKVVLTYEPESVEDQQTIDAYGGLDNTPAYLVRLRPVLKVNEERIIVAQDGRPMGEDYTLTVEMISPNGVETFTTHPIIGNLSVLGIVSQKAFLDAQPATRDTQPDAPQLLYEAALHYADRWGRAEDELASLMRRSISRPIPSIVIVGGVINVTYLLDTPHGFEWKGVFVDAAVRGIETIGCCMLQSGSVGELERERVKAFMQLSALQGSILENRIFEDDFKVESISTAKLFTLLNAQAETGNPLLTLTPSNTPTLLPTLPFPAEIKEDIANAVNQGWVVRIPSLEMTYRDWRGIGYLKEDPETGEAGWMLSGEIAGGESVISPEDWVNQDLRNTLNEAFRGRTNGNSSSAFSIIKIPPTNEQKGTVGERLHQELAVLVKDKDGLPVLGASVTFRVVAGGGSFGQVDGPATKTVITTGSGIAKVPFVLGKRTGDNPYYRITNLEAPNQFPTQVGLNLVTASVASASGDISLVGPFQAYGEPGPPDHFLKILGDGSSSLANNPGGSVWVRLEDQYGNPISNETVVFRALDPTSLIPLPLNDTNFRNIQFYRKQDCSNRYPLAGDCTTVSNLSVQTEYFGAMVETMMGNTVNTAYTVQVSTARLPQDKFATVTLYSLGFRSQEGNYIPPALLTGSLTAVNDRGQPVNAAKVGEALKRPLVTELFFIHDEYRMEPYSCTQNNQPATCYRIKASGIVHTDHVSNGAVTYRDVDGAGAFFSDEAIGPSGSQVEVGSFDQGKYRTGYITQPPARENIIEVSGKATVTVPEALYNPTTLALISDNYPSPTLESRSVNLNAGESIRFDRDTRAPIYRTIAENPKNSIFGVEVQLTVEPNFIVITDAGFATTDTLFKYTILPKEYNAVTAQIDLYKGEDWQGFVVGDRTQTPEGPTGGPIPGEAILTRGFLYKVDQRYEAEAVLNRGMETEIRSDRENVQIGRFDVLNDVEPTPTTPLKEMKFGRGDNEEKRYHIQIKSPKLTDTCETLNGTGVVRVVDSNGTLFQVPQAESGTYFLPLYTLSFTTDHEQCLVTILDSTTVPPTERTKFIVSNLSRTALGPTGMAVLYGGIGNHIEIEIAGAKREVPIEPVGVFVIGIDGLRQDVLYNSDEASYSDLQGCDGTSCNVPVDDVNLPGLSQILTEDGTIKLRNVTAVFPSITLASWASIFTGKLPGETGILGNEFFARDLSLQVPSKFNSPPGMITFASGSFPGYDAFGIPGIFGSDFLVPGKSDSLVSASIEKAPQNYSQVLTAPTVYESIGSIPGVQTYFAGKGGMSLSPPTPSIRGGAHWVTWDFTVGCHTIVTCSSELMDKSSKDKLNEYLRRRYLSDIPFSNKRNDVPFSALTTWYLSGLDHAAHEAGMGAYRNHFLTNTDLRIAEVVGWLKTYGEFDNKIFLITADHGMTAMPEFSPVLFPDGRIVQPNTSCELKVDGFDDINTQDSEKTNNNLHIWELAEVFKVVGESTPFRYKVLAPEQIAALFRDKNQQELPYSATSDINKANLISALNGPMAHIYLKSDSGWGSLPSDDEIGRVALVFKRLFQESGVGLDVDLRNQFSRLVASVDYILIRIGNEYRIFNGFDQNGQLIPPSPISLDTLKYIKANERIQGMNHPKRSGDIVLIMKDDVNDVNQRFTTGVACKSWHGSLNRNDSYVPLIVAYPGGNKTVLEDIINQATICPGGLCEGNWKANDIVLEFIRRQYR